jgi:hypothetical protein
LLADQAAPPVPGSPLSHREAQLKLKALNQATVKLASQLEQREAENKRLKQQLDKVQCSLNKGCRRICLIIFLGTDYIWTFPSIQFLNCIVY